MPRLLTVAGALLGCHALVAQSVSTVPPVCATLPGNAAISLPLRWSQGTLQVFVDAPLLPANFVGQTITGLRLRRSVLPGDVGYQAITRTLTVRGGFSPSLAMQFVGSLGQNRPMNTQVLFGPTPVTVAATPAPGPGTTVGESFVQIAFAQPLPVAAGTLFLELQASDGPLQILTDNWVDAVSFDSGFDDGLVVTVGDGSCTTRPEPTWLRWTSQQGPVAGTTRGLELTGAPPTNGVVLVWAGLDPETAAPGSSYVGYGGTFAAVDPAMAGCHMWAPLDVAWFGLADGTGKFVTQITLPGNAMIGQRIALQAAWLDSSRPILPLSFSNGLQLVCNSAGVGARCSSFFFPGQATVSPWGPFRGHMPVLLLEY